MTDDAKLLAAIDWAPALDADRWELIQHAALVGLGDRNPDLLEQVDMVQLNVVPAEGIEQPWMLLRCGQSIICQVHRDSLLASSDTAVVRYADGSELVVQGFG